MKIRQNNSKVKRGFKIVSLLLSIPLATMLLLYLANETATLFGKSDEWDSLSFVGAIIGGALTLVGVRMTLLQSNRDQIIKSFPQKLYYLDEIIGKIEICIAALEIDIEKGSTISKSLRQYVESKESLESYLTKSMEIGTRAMVYVREYIELMKEMDAQNENSEEYKKNLEWILIRMKRAFHNMDRIRDRVIDQYEKANDPIY